MAKQRKPAQKPAGRRLRAPAAGKTPKTRTKVRAPAGPRLEPIAGDREAYLLSACTHLREMVRYQMIELGMEVRHTPVPAVSVGYPRGTRSRTGTGWIERNAATGQAQVYVSPAIGIAGKQHHTLLPEGAKHYSAEVRLLDVLLHQIIHDAVGEEHGHLGPFREVARACGLVGSMTDSYASPALQERLQSLLDKHLGNYPHVPVVEPKKPKDAPGHRHQRSRQNKWVCSKCGRIIRCASGEPDALHFCNGLPETAEQMIEEVKRGNVGRFIEPKSKC